MIEKSATVRNDLGIHCRPSAVIIKECGRYAGQMGIGTESGPADLRSLIALVALGLEKGARVDIRVSGPDEERVCARLVELFETHFDFPPLPEQERARTRESILSRAEGS